MEFHGYQVLDLLLCFKVIYSSYGDFMQWFPLGHSAKEHFFKLLGCVMNNIEHNFINTIFIERILQWKAAVQKLIRIGFAVEFLLVHLQ